MYAFADSFAGYDPANYDWSCTDEFGPHDEHSDCQRIIANMSPDFPDQTDYSDWYGGEQGYQDGLRWSDFV